MKYNSNLPSQANLPNFATAFKEDEENPLFSLGIYVFGWGSIDFPYERFCQDIWIAKTEDCLLDDEADPKDNWSASVRQRENPYEIPESGAPALFDMPTYGLKYNVYLPHVEENPVESGKSEEKKTKNYIF